ncbi:adenosylcobalamin-dependent ribonucleoside-diphosphate reductase [Methanobacterium bryantii]|uniref:adenosylcobalamin-dependent ribonucleoside-diphosphate reductase n=1 Tax=Methanobacterium bryantii TaxID=2161 RepID=UPI0023B9F213|nr:adenosylcobalamin-dependent ribonucleoside-diphosphate reductase [Methanobacterium bryantii]
MSFNALKVLQKRYLLKDEDGNIIETPEKMFKRVSKAVAGADNLYNDTDAYKTEKKFYRAMSGLEFLPNSPTLMNAGTPINQLSACFVIYIEDSINGIFNALKHMALIHKSGGGVGFSFSKIRPKGDVVKSTKGVASGPTSFMKIFDVATEVIKQGGRRRGANMGILDIRHPDIIEFITSKEHEGVLTNFNISTAVDDEFMNAAVNNEEYDLINPRNVKHVKKLNAGKVFDTIVNTAWKCGDPGIIFIDEINRKNTIPNAGIIEASNPCAEQPLLNYESCNLGSINLTKMVKSGKIDFNKLKSVVETAVHFLDNVIDINNFPISKVETETLKNRKIGLGIMGFAEMLIMLEIPYDSQDALDTAEKIMKFVTYHARKVSAELGRLRGSFPNFKGSIYDKNGFQAMRNATVTTIAPTGTISIIADTTSGIEPLFAVSFIRDVMEGEKLLEVNKLFESTAKKEGFYSKELMTEIAKKGSIQNIDEISGSIKRIFQTAHEISPKWHVKMQAAFQKHVDNAVSKTVNLPNNASPEDVKEIMLMAYKLKCKGITVYRYGSKKQVLYLNSYQGNNKKYLNVDSEYSGGCPSSRCPL